MRTGLITTYTAKNFGAMLQAVGLTKAISQLGHEAVVIDYRYQNQPPEKICNFTGNFKEKIISLLTLVRYRKVRKRFSRAKQFRQENLPFSKEYYDGFESLAAHASDYDAFVCGSDQLWRPGLHFDPAFLLTFADASKFRKVAYAPSFGVSQIPEAYGPVLREAIADIPHVSVRESQGAEIIREWTGREVPVVLDPTLLHERDFWSSLATPPKTKLPDSYIVVYTREQNSQFNAILTEVKKRTKLPVVVIPPHALNRISGTDYCLYDSGPAEFLDLFSKATCICTNSFHGVAFSIIFRKPFWGNPHSTANSRMESLLQRLGLSDRQIVEPADLPSDPLQIDYTEAERLLNEEREAALRFLRDSLS